MTQSHSTLLKEKQQLEERLEQINKQLNDRRPPRTMDEVRLAMNEAWDMNIDSKPFRNNKLLAPGYSCSEQAEEQVQALRDVQAICKALNDYYGGNSFGYITPDGYRICAHKGMLDLQDQRHHAITNLYSPEACQEFLNNPEFMERLRTLYTPCE